MAPGQVPPPNQKALRLNPSQNWRPRVPLQYNQVHTMNEPVCDNKVSTSLPKLPDGIYWPFKRLPGVKLAAYAMVCVETALECSDEAQAIYAEVIQSWELPGCQVLIREFAPYKQDTETWLRSLDKALEKNKPLADWPTAWTNVFMKAKDNADFHELLKRAAYLVLVGFNRKIDLDNKTLKILPENSPYLIWAIVFHSVSDYFLIKPEVKGPRAWSDKSIAGFVQFYHTLTTSPTTRKGRKEKHATVQTLRREGYSLCHFSNFDKVAEQWYKCRVNPGTIEGYLDELAHEGIYLDRSNIENAIAPCDEATGYPRKWRK